MMLKRNALNTAEENVVANRDLVFVFDVVHILIFILTLVLIFIFILIVVVASVGDA